MKHTSLYENNEMINVLSVSNVFHNTFKSHQTILFTILECFRLTKRIIREIYEQITHTKLMDSFGRLQNGTTDKINLI